MYGMARNNALPQPFAYVSARSGVPNRNVLACGALALIGAWSMSYQLGAEMLNFGAFLAFSGVNLACFKHDFLNSKTRKWTDAAFPLLGLAVCLYIWISLRWQAKLAGSIWVLAGLIYFWLRDRLRSRS
jgi:putrescine importer